MNYIDILTEQALEMPSQSQLKEAGLGISRLLEAGATPQWISERLKQEGFDVTLSPAKDAPLNENFLKVIRNVSSWVSAVLVGVGLITFLVFAGATVPMALAISVIGHASVGAFIAGLIAVTAHLLKELLNK